MPRHASILAAALTLALASGCQRRPGPTSDPDETPSEDSTEARSDRNRRAQASRRPRAGATCAGHEDCTSDQVCIGGRCAYRNTSVAGEILAAAAMAQEQTGNWDGAMESYQTAFARFEEQDAPVPPEIACGAAELTLRTATDPDTRERGAEQADLCFRTTVSGHPARVPVQRALARLRYEGLDIALFDADEPAERFFTQEPSRPTVDVVVTELEMPDLEPEPAGFVAVREQLESAEGRRTVAECFIQDWEGRQQSEASAEIGIRYSTRLRDMGSYDVYERQISIEQTTSAEDGFEPCLANGLPSLFEADRRATRSESWNQVVRITARTR